MNRRISIILTCALAIASLASYTVFRLSAPVQRSTPEKPAAPMAQLVVAARDLEIGALVRESDLTMANWPGVPPTGSIGREAGAVDRGVISAIYRGEPVMENRLAPAGAGAGLAATIPAGMRACAVRVNEVVGVAGFAVPGMRVDVLMAGAAPGENSGGTAVKTLLQNIEVLSAGANFERDKEGKPQQVQVVNLLVNPHQAEILSLAGNESRIQLVLRNPADTAVTAPPGTSMAELFGGLKARLPAAPEAALPVAIPQPAAHADPPEIIEVLNGQTRTLSTFQSDGESQGESQSHSQ